MINFLSTYGPFSNEDYWRNGIVFKNQSDVWCLVELFREERKFVVKTSDDPKDLGLALQGEICSAFKELGKNAEAEISLDGKLFVSLEKLKEKLNKGKSSVILDVTMEEEVSIYDYAHLVEAKEMVKRGGLGVELVEIEDFLANGEIEQTILAMRQYCRGNTELSPKILEISARFKTLIKKQDGGNISAADATLEQNNIIRTLSSLFTKMSV